MIAGFVYGLFSLSFNHDEQYLAGIQACWDSDGDYMTPYMNTGFYRQVQAYGTASSGSWLIFVASIMSIVASSEYRAHFRLLLARDSCTRTSRTVANAWTTILSTH